MTDNNPFFRFIGRLNAIGLLCLLLTIGTWFGAWLIPNLIGQDRETGVVQISRADQQTAGPVRTSLHVGPFRPAAGTVFEASLFDGPTERPRKLSLSRDTGTTRNILFFDSGSGDLRRLFAHDRGAVVAQRTVERHVGAGQRKTVARLYVYVEADTDGDGSPTEDDRQRIVVTRPDGSGAITIADGIDAADITDPVDAVTITDGVDAHEADPATLSFFVRKGNESRFIGFDLARFAVTRETPLVLPDAAGKT